MTPFIEHTDLYVGGSWIPSTGTDHIEVFSPRNGELIGRVPHATAADVDAAVAAAREAFDRGPWPRLSLDERIDVVSRLKDALLARCDELAELISRENGSPITVAVRSQVMGAVAVYASAIATATAFTFEEERRGMSGPMVVRHEPVGVVAAVVPWNFPQALLASKLAPALLAGCTVIVKPSPQTPLDAYVLAEVADEVGLPAGVLSVLPADRDTSAYLVSHPGVDKVAFTGSVATGKSVMAAAAGNLTRVTLELGGKSAAILLEDADVDAAIPHLVAGGFLNSGQACMALTRVLAPSSRYDEVATKLAAAIRALPVGDPADPTTVIGPMSSAQAQQRNLDYIRIAQEQGATVLAGGGVPEGLDHGWYVEPTLLGDVDNDMRVAQEEIFGPVVCLIRYDGEEEAIDLANASDFGLSGAVFTQDDDHGLAIARRIRTGTYSVNCQRVDFGGPFGGFKNSGIGREFAAEGLASYLETKTIHLPTARSRMPDPDEEGAATR